MALVAALTAAPLNNAPQIRKKTRPLQWVMYFRTPRVPSEYSRTAPAPPLTCMTTNRPSNCPRSCSNNYRLPFMFVIGRVSFFDTTVALPSYGAGRLNSAILMNGFPDRIECSAPTAVSHHQCPMADVLRTGVSVRGEEVHIERPTKGSRARSPCHLDRTCGSGEVELTYEASGVIFEVTVRWIILKHSQDRKAHVPPVLANGNAPRGSTR